MRHTMKHTMKHAMKNALISLMLLTLSAAAHAASWQFVTIWAPGFCATAPAGMPLCQSENAAADHLLSLQLKSPQGRCADTGRTAAAFIPKKSDETYLAVLGSKEWAEYWQQYGACSGMTAAHYLSTNVEMAKRISQTSLGKVLRENIGKLVDKEQLLTALRHDYFVGADRKAALVCRQRHLISVQFSPRDWSDLFLKMGQGGMLDTASANTTLPDANECPDLIEL